MSVLQVEHLSTEFDTEQGVVQAVRDVSFCVEEGEILGIVGDVYKRQGGSRAVPAPRWYWSSCRWRDPGNLARWRWHM